METMRVRSFSAVVMASLTVCASGAAAAAQGDPRTALLAKAGWEAVVAGQARAAADAFRQALAGDPKNAQLHLGAGTAAYLERRNEDARDAFERALALDPKLNRARALLGQVLDRMGDVPGAIRIYETLAESEP